MGGGSWFLPAGNVKTEDVYTFDFTSRFELRTVSSGTGGSRNTGGSSGESSLLEFEFLYNSSEPYAATVLAWSDTGEPESNSTIIFDRKNAAMVMLMEQDGEKASASFAMDTSLSDLDRMEAEKNAADLEATGRMPASDADGSSDASVQDIGSFGYLYGGYDALGKKKILSFDAEGYRYSSTGYDVEVWISPEPAEGFAKRFSMSRSMQAFSMLPLFDSGNGIVVEMSMSLQNGGVTERISYRMTEFNPRARRVFRMSEYPTAGTE